MRYLSTVAAALLLAGTAFASPADADTISVGADSSCDFHSLDRAIDAVARTPKQHRIRLARNLVQVLTDAERVPHGVQLVGGYSNCADQTALGYTEVRMLRSPSPDLLAGANRVRFETGDPARLSLKPAAARDSRREAESMLQMSRVAR